MSATLHDVVNRLSDAMVEGNLDVRGDVAGLAGEDAKTVELVNRMIDALIIPIRLAGTALDEIANGELPHFVIEPWRKAPSWGAKPRMPDCNLPSVEPNRTAARAGCLHP